MSLPIQIITTPHHLFAKFAKFRRVLAMKPRSTPRAHQLHQLQSRAKRDRPPQVARRASLRVKPPEATPFGIRHHPTSSIANIVKTVKTVKTVKAPPVSLLQEQPRHPPRETRIICRIRKIPAEERFPCSHHCARHAHQLRSRAKRDRPPQVARRASLRVKPPETTPSSFVIRHSSLPHILLQKQPRHPLRATRHPRTFPFPPPAPHASLVDPDFAAK